MYGPQIWFAVAYTHAVPIDGLPTRYGGSLTPGGKLAHKRSAAFPGPEWMILRDGQLRSLEQSSVHLHDTWCGACTE